MKIATYRVNMSGSVTKFLLQQDESIDFDYSVVEGGDELSQVVGFPGWEYDGEGNLVGFLTLDKREADLVAEAIKLTSLNVMQSMALTFLSLSASEDRGSLEDV